MTEEHRLSLLEAFSIAGEAIQELRNQVAELEQRVRDLEYQSEDVPK